MFTFLAIASFSAVVVHEQDWFGIDPAILGLALWILGPTLIPPGPTTNTSRNGIGKLQQHIF